MVSIDLVDRKFKI